MNWQPRSVFALLVRILGLFCVYRAVPCLASFIDIKLFPTTDRPPSGAAANLVYVMLDLSLAALCLLGTRTVVTLSYGDEPAGDRPEA